MHLFVLTLLSVIFYLIYLYGKKRKNYFEDLGLPYVPFSIFGLFTGPLFRRDHLSNVLKYIYNYNSDAKYVGTFEFFYKPILVIRDFDIIKDITIKNFDHFTDRPTRFDTVNDPLIGDNLTFMNGKRWHEARTLLSPTFTSSKMKLMFEQMVNCAENFTDHMAKYASDSKQMIETKNLIRKYTADVIASCVYGINLDSMKNPDDEFYVIAEKVVNFEGLVALKLFLIRSAPKIARILGITFISNDITNFFKDIVRMAIETRDEKGYRRPDMMQLMMDARGKTFDKLKIDTTQIAAETFIFLFGGFETTTTQICMLAHELAINPDVQKKLQAEIDEVLINTNGKLTYEAINEMTYLNAVITESNRKHNVIGIINRVCTKPYELPPNLPGEKPFTIKRGTNIMIPIPGIHYDEKYYKDPEKFFPERYLQKDTNNQLPFLTFGMGPRNCIGSRFAKLEMKILFFYLLSKYTLRSNVKTCNPIEYDKKSVAMAPKGGFWLSLEFRNLTNNHKL